MTQFYYDGQDIVKGGLSIAIMGETNLRGRSPEWLCLTLEHLEGKEEHTEVTLMLLEGLRSTLDKNENEINE